jgi:APA family basic amino acid/polyamine antiporter
MATRPPTEASLVRAIGLFGLTAAVVNVTVGGGIYRLPAAAAQGLGTAAPLAYLACALAMVFIVICFAEAGRRVPLTGGVYAYVEVAFGPLAGLLTGFMLWAGLCATFAAVVSFLGDAVAEMVPALKPAPWRSLPVLLVIAVMAVLNVLGVRLADRFNAVATVAKVAPLLGLLVFGVSAVQAGNLPAPSWPPLADLARTSAVLIFAFLGVETALVPSGEVRDPARTVPRAVFLAIGMVTVLYAGLHLVAQGILGPALAQQKAPLAEAAGVAVGDWARSAVLAASVFSILIYASGMMLAVPRLLYAFARDGFLPRGLAAVHERYRTPHRAIVAQAVLVAGLAVSGTFEKLAVLGNASVLIAYVFCCAAAWQLRRRNVGQPTEGADVPGAAIAPFFALVLIGWLLSSLSLVEWLASAAVAAVAVALYLARRPGSGTYDGGAAPREEG